MLVMKRAETMDEAQEVFYLPPDIETALWRISADSINKGKERYTFFSQEKLQRREVAYFSSFLQALLYAKQYYLQRLKEFQASDKKYNWTIPELIKLPIKWYGGADLSKMHDLTSVALYGYYEKEDVDIIITHGFFPIVEAAHKADEDRIPLFGWKDDGWLTMCNNPTVNYADIVNWFIMMRKMGFKIKQVCHIIRRRKNLRRIILMKS